MNKRNKYSHPHIYSLVYHPVSHTPTHIHLPLTKQSSGKQEPIPYIYVFSFRSLIAEGMNELA